MMICGYLFYTFGDGVGVRIPTWLTFVIFIRDFLIITFAYLLYTRISVRRFPPSPAGKASTLLQAINLAATIAANGAIPQLRPALDILFRVTLVVTLFSAWDYLRRGERLLEDGVRASEA